MKSLIETLLMAIGIWGEKLGLGIVIAVSVSDFFMTGARGFLEYKISYLGILVIWLGIALIVASKHIDKVTK